MHAYWRLVLVTVAIAGFGRAMQDAPSVSRDAASPDDVPHTPSSAPASQPAPSPDEALWRRIVRLRAPGARTEPYAAYIKSERSRRETLRDLARSYLRLYPGGDHAGEAVRVELEALFELGVQSGGEFDALRATVRDYLAHPPTATAEAEAKYWRIVLSEQGRRDDNPSDRAAPRRSAALLADYREYIAEYPGSVHTPRLASVLIYAALQRDDLAEAHRLLRRLAEAHPDHQITAELTGLLRRHDAIGMPFRMECHDFDERPVTTGVGDDQVTAILVWATFDPDSLAVLRELAALRRAKDNLRLIGVNIDPDADVARRFLAQHEIECPQCHDGLGWATGFLREYGVTEIPFVFVVDRSGRLVAADRDGWRRALGTALEN